MSTASLSRANKPPASPLLTEPKLREALTIEPLSDPAVAPTATLTTVELFPTAFLRHHWHFLRHHCHLYVVHGSGLLTSRILYTT